MKADWGLLGGAAAAMLALPLLVLAWSGTPLGTGLPGGTTSDPTPQQSNILPGTDREEPEEPPADTFSVLPSFRILDETTGQVAEIPAADYVAGAIAAEMPASYEEDALIAQGMAAYTNAHYLAALRRADPPEELNGADFSADPSKRLGYITDDTMKAMWGDHYKAYRKSHAIPHHLRRPAHRGGVFCHQRRKNHRRRRKCVGGSPSLPHPRR